MEEHRQTAPTKQEKHQPRTLSSLCKLKNAGYNLKAKRIKKKNDAPMEAAPSGGRKRHCHWRFPAPMASPALLLLLPDPAAVKALTGMATCNVKSPAMSALSSRACHLSDMHEVASSTGASHVGYVQKKHPLGNISRRALFWEFVSKSTLNRDNCLMFALVFHELNFWIGGHYHIPERFSFHG